MGLDALCDKAVVFLNIDPQKVGFYTPYELNLIAKQKEQNEQNDFEKILALAWHTEAFARQKKLMRFEKLIRQARRKTASKTPSPGDAILKAMAKEKGVIL